MASQFVRDERHLHAPVRSGRAASQRERTEAFPYHVPGPAGTDFSATLTQQPRALNGTNAAYFRDRNRTKSHSGTKSFQSSAWHRLLQGYGIRPYGSEFLKASISIIKNNAFRGNFDRLNLAVRVQSLQVLGLYPSVTLEDPTGTIVATVLGEVLEDRSTRLEAGTVLMLKDVFAVMYSDRDNKGFHINLNSKVHMSIQSTNIEAIFRVNEDCQFERKQLTNPYAEGALERLMLDQNILRTQRNKVLKEEVRKPIRTILAEYDDNNNSYNNFNNRGRGRGGPGYYNSSRYSRGRGGGYHGGQNFSPYARGRGRGRGGGQDYSPYGSGRGRGGQVGNQSSPYGRGRGREHGQDSSPYGTGRGGVGRGDGQFRGNNSSWNGRGRGAGVCNTPPGSARGRPPPGRGGLQPPQSHRNSFYQPSAQLSKRPYGNGNEIDAERPVQRPRPNTPHANIAPMGTSARQEKPAASALSDAQLDDILGNFDIDAAISQATQSSAPVPQKTQTPAISQVTESAQVSVPTKESTIERPSTNGPPSRVRPLPQRKTAPKQQAAPGRARSGEAEKTKSAPIVAAPAAPANGREGVSGMDDAALSELLGGLDGTEFD